MISYHRLWYNSLEYCISISSSESSNCIASGGKDISANWEGDIITVYHNNVEIGQLPNAFTQEELCLPAADVDVANDKFKFVNGGTHGVSILFVR